MISKVLANIGNSKAGQKFFGWASQPKSEKFLNNTLPQIETVFSTACYMISTAKQKNIDDDRKKMLQIQHVASGAVGLTVASFANRAVGKFGESVAKNLDPKKLDPNAIKQVTNGIKVGLPIVTTAFCMRFAIPTAIALFSGKTMDKVREHRKNKLDVKG